MKSEQYLPLTLRSPLATTLPVSIPHLHSSCCHVTSAQHSHETATDKFANDFHVTQYNQHCLNFFFGLSVVTQHFKDLLLELRFLVLAMPVF